VVHTNGGEVSVFVTQERWGKTKAVLDHIWEEFVLLKAARESQMTEEDAITGMQHKHLERDCGFIVYVAQTYPAMVPYLKGTHLTLDGWRGGRY
jgi:hypothetical protein